MRDPFQTLKNALSMSRSMSWNERVLDAVVRAKELSLESTSWYCLCLCGVAFTHALDRAFITPTTDFEAVSTTAVTLFQSTKQSKKRLARTACTSTTHICLYGCRHTRLMSS